jgi:hypothetical protein
MEIGVLGRSSLASSPLNFRVFSVSYFQVSYHDERCAVRGDGDSRSVATLPFLLACPFILFLTMSFPFPYVDKRYRDDGDDNSRFRASTSVVISSFLTKSFSSYIKKVAVAFIATMIVVVRRFSRP